MSKPTRENESALILFPEVIGTIAAAAMSPILLVQAFLSGRIVFGLGGLVWWGVALYAAIRLVSRRRYAAAFIPMLMLLGLAALLYRKIPF